MLRPCTTSFTIVPVTVLVPQRATLSCSIYSLRGVLKFNKHKEDGRTRSTFHNKL